MKKLFLLLFIALPLSSMAQTNEGIQFETGTWDEITAKSKATGKPIFLDCYTSWCGPCKALAKNIFPLKEVGDYFNANFINAKFDMEKGEGIELKKKYNVTVFPTLLFINSEGEELNRIVGGASDATKFLYNVKKGMESQKLYHMRKQFADGDRSDVFVTEFLKALEASYLKKEAEAVVLDLFKDKKDYEKLKNKTYWAYFMVFVSDVNSKLFSYVHKNRAEFAQIYGKRELDNKMYQTWLGTATKFVKKADDGTKYLDKKGYDAFLKKMKREKVDYLPLLIANSDISNAGKLEKWDEYATLVEARLKETQEKGLSSTTMVEYGKNIANYCKDETLRKRCLPYFESALKQLEETRKESVAKGTSMKESFAKAFEVATNEKILEMIIEELKK